jgi:hypothetical protein
LPRAVRGGILPEHSYPDKRKGGGGDEPLELLALIPPRPAEADKQRDHGTQPGHKQHRNRDEQEYHIQYMGRALIAGHQRWTPLGPEHYHGRHDSQANGEATEPGNRAPAMRRRVPIGEQQWQEHQDQAEPGGPNPLPEPEGFRSQWESAGICEERIDCLLVCGAHEPIAEALGQEDPADWVLGTVRGDQSTDDRERHRQDGEGGY